MPRVAGHKEGAEAVRRVVEAAPESGIGTLTLYAFSSDNWQRPPREVSALMRLLRTLLRTEAPKLAENGVRLSVIGRRDRLALPLCTAIDEAESVTCEGTELHLRVAIDYSSRDAILRAAQRTGGRAASRAEFARALAEAMHAGDGAPDVDLLIRTGGEQRLSDFLLWECAYAELYFTDLMWPEFDARALNHALDTFRSRERRFGKVVASVAAG
jgi:undecaprenyl diphosphate synthase